MTENKSLSYKDINNSGNIISSKEHFNLKYIEELKNKKLVFKKINNNQRLYVKTNSNFAIAFELDDKNICHILLVDEKNGSENDLTGEFNIEKERQFSIGNLLYNFKFSNQLEQEITEKILGNNTLKEYKEFNDSINIDFEFPEQIENVEEYKKNPTEFSVKISTQNNRNMYYSYKKENNEKKFNFYTNAQDNQFSLNESVTMIYKFRDFICKEVLKGVFENPKKPELLLINSGELFINNAKNILSDNNYFNNEEFNDFIVDFIKMIDENLVKFKEIEGTTLTSILKSCVNISYDYLSSKLNKKDKEKFLEELINKNSVLLILEIFDAFKISKDLNIKEITNLKVENIAKLSSVITRLSILGKKNEYEEIINNLNNIIFKYAEKEKNYFLNSFIENYYSFYIREGKNKNFSFMLIGLENIFNNYDYNFNKNIFDKIFYVKLEDNYDQIHFLEAAKIANFINEDYYQEIINKNPHLKLLNDNLLLYYDIETSNEEIANILSNAIYETNDKVNASNFSNTINNIEKEFKKTPNDIKEIIKLTMDKIVDNKEISPFLIKPLTERLVFNYENFVNGKMFFNKYQYGLSDIKKFYDKLKKEQNKSYLFDLKNKAVLNRKNSKMEELDFSKKETMNYFFNNLFLFSSEYAIKNNIEKNEMKKAKDEYNFFRKNKKIAINLGINVDPELKLDKELEEKIYCYYEQKTIDNHIVEDNKIETEARQINNNELIKDNHNTIDTQNLDKETLDSLSNDNEKLDNLLKEQKNNTLSEGLEAIDDLLIKQQKEEKSIPDKY